MAISKVIFNGDTLMDVTGDSVTANNLLSGESATGANGQKVAGSIPNRGAVAATVNAGTTMSVQAGYWDAGTVSGQILSGDAVSSQVLTGKTFYNTSSAVVTGSMPNRGAANSTVNACTTYAIQAGYWDAGTCTGQQLSGNAVASQVYTGKTFYNNTSAKVTGSMATNGTLTSTHSSATAGAASTYTVRPSAAGYFTTAITSELVATQSGTIAPAGGTGTVSVNIKPGYYNKIVVNRTNAYNAGTAAGAASVTPTFTKIGTYGFNWTTQTRPTASATSATFSATNIAGYKNLTSQNFFPRITSVVYGHGAGNGNKGTYSFTTPPAKIAYTASSGLGTISNLLKGVGSNSEFMDCALLVDLYCVH